MILEALHTKINSIVNAFPLIGDIEADAPFAVYSADQSVLRTKSGIIGYEYDVQITVVHPELSVCFEKSDLIKAAVETLDGTTTNDTTFESVRYVSENQRYDAQALYHINDIIYKVFTTNV